MSFNLNVRHRSRLSHADVKLILFLIVQIKPFKYVGDRTLSQSRKWDLIQQKLEQHKLRSHHPAGVVPTVRTLQRQMATALQRAQHRHQTDHYVPFLVFTTLSRSSPLVDLELAVLELYNLSEAYKTGQTVGPLPEQVSQALEGDLLADVDLELPESEPTRAHSDVLDHLRRSLLLGPDRDDSEVPESVAPIVSRIRMVLEQNRTFYNECLLMLRLQSAAMNERLIKLEELVIASGKTMDLRKQELEDEFKQKTERERVLRSILLLLN
ncbi:CIC11C00000000869 [Sungouiella intermedia]|uniref:CIC11C00000000869 n=1 Tax=Sungouiella intermedia TaxID=45354 RepID=A0A1L0G505_9ASCO|nr:CIC11C00000000869 [[Candida] intermedia]SGZ51653.1 CIC11C00000001810 [[Candida] intermedia]